jgi:5-formaminoimidazole-4-carboxamide-1-beta-D-ribofuranosyl 5'-monophosphate synthetase
MNEVVFEGSGRIVGYTQVEILPVVRRYAEVGLGTSFTSKRRVALRINKEKSCEL